MDKIRLVTKTALMLLAVLACALFLSACETAKGVGQTGKGLAYGIGTTAVGVSEGIGETAKGAAKDSYSFWGFLKESDNWIQENLW